MLDTEKTHIRKHQSYRLRLQCFCLSMEPVLFLIVNFAVKGRYRVKGLMFSRL